MKRIVAAALLAPMVPMAILTARTLFALSDQSSPKLMMLVGVNVALIFYALAAAMVLLALLPAHVIAVRRRFEWSWQYVAISLVVGLAGFGLFGQFSGDWGTYGDWAWIALASISLGVTFRSIAAARYPS